MRTRRQSGIHQVATNIRVLSVPRGLRWKGRHRMQEVKKTLYDYFRVRTDEAFADDDNLFNNGLLDSMGVLELVYHLETKLNIEVDPDDISESNFRTIDSIAALAGSKLS